MPSYLLSIGTAVPPHRISQQQVKQFMAQTLHLNEGDRRKLNIVYDRSGIDTRYTFIEDYGHAPGSFSFFPNNGDASSMPGTAARMELYRKHALGLCLQAVNDCLRHVPAASLNQVTHLITVSCTGMYAPGLDVELVEALQLPSNVERTSIAFMGCYAAFNALKVADYIVRAQPGAKVLVVAVELCSLHFKPGMEEDQLLSNALFGDGAAAALIGACATQPSTLSPLALTSFYSEFAAGGKKDMAWHVGDAGFEIRLSSYVPQLVKEGIGDLVQKLLHKAGSNGTHNGSADASVQLDYYAIHPGGMRILDACQTALGISAQQLQPSYDVLKAYGNMSSATILFVLRRWMERLNGVDHGKHVLACAFGPGLTMESMILTVA
jgi:predicted naringenin-chalcone synthase